jgi:hypothetical protein
LPGNSGPCSRSKGLLPMTSRARASSSYRKSRISPWIFRRNSSKTSSTCPGSPTRRSFKRLGRQSLRRFDASPSQPEGPTPFGAVSLGAKKEFEKAYPRTKNDIYAAFVERGIQLLHTGGFLGAITSRTGFFLSSFQKWREEILLKEAPPVVFADLGNGVLDTAMVEVAAYCLEKGRGS